jgi:putative nucleotidyltransferase with HDIG domain
MGSLPLPRINQEGFVSYLAQPLKTKGDLVGVLEILHRSRLNPGQDWFDFAEILAGQAAITIDSITRMENLQAANTELSLAADAIIESWASSMEIHGLEPEGHSKRTTELTLRLARRMGVPNHNITAVRRGSLLHDIGKLALPDRIHHKPGPLDEEEWDLVRQHPLNAVEILNKVDFLQPSLDIPRCHHERWDGSGYPDGLKGEEIPLPARIFAVADVWDILRSDRPYRKAWTTNKTLQYLKDQAGELFDPRVVEEFLDIREQLENTR